MIFTDASEVISVLWLFKLLILFLVSIVTGWFYTAGLKNNFELRVSFSLLLGLIVAPLMAVSHIHFSLLTYVVVMFVIVILGYIFLYSRSANIPIAHELNPKPFYLIAITIFILVLGLTSIGMLSHWDHILAPTVYSMDYARSGDPYSPWVEQNISGRWVLAQQTIALALDALEMLWFDTFTAALSKYITILHILIIALLVGRFNRISSLLFLGVLSIYAVDQLIAFRPHIYVGLLLVILLMLRDKYPKAIIPMIIVLIYIFLAKRDGVIIAPLLAILMLSNKLKIVALIFCIPLVLIGGFMAKVGGVSVGALFFQGVTNVDVIIDSLVILSNHNFYIPLLLSASIYFSFYKRVDFFSLFVVILILCGLIYFSTVILVSEERYNFGTISRKIEYFLFPVLLLMSYMALDNILVGSKAKIFLLYTEVVKNRLSNLTLSKLNGGLVYMLRLSIVGLMMLLVSKSIVIKLSEFDYTIKNTTEWTESVVNNIELYRSFIPDSDEVKIGFYYTSDESFRATPFKDLDLYKFPILQAYNGNDLKLEGDLFNLTDRDIIFLSHEVSEVDCLEYSKDTNMNIKYLYGGMKVLLNAKGEEFFNDKYIIKYSSGKHFSHALTHNWLFKDSLEWLSENEIRSYFNSWNPQHFQHKVVWSIDPETWSSAIYFEIDKGEMDYVHMLTFKAHPLGDSLPSKIYVETASGISKYIVKDLLLNGTYFVPIEASGWFKVEMYSDGMKSEFWKAPYFSIFSLSLLIKE